MSILKPLALSLAAGAGAAVAVYALLSMQKKHRRRKRLAPITAPAAATPLRAKDGETLVAAGETTRADELMRLVEAQRELEGAIQSAMAGGAHSESPRRVARDAGFSEAELEGFDAGLTDAELEGIERDARADVAGHA